MDMGVSFRDRVFYSYDLYILRQCDGKVLSSCSRRCRRSGTQTKVARGQPLVFS